jgi:hypothetical protein
MFNESWFYTIWHARDGSINLKLDQIIYTLPKIIHYIQSLKR